MTTQITCPVCNGTGSSNNPPSFHDEGRTPDVSTNCGFCNGQGTLEVENPVGVRAAVLVARKIQSNYTQFKNWEDVYRLIETNIISGVNAAASSALWRKQYNEPEFEIDSIFSEGPLSIDKTLETWIEKGSYIEEAKTILRLK